ncbi:amino acid permease [Pseudonocardia parietis]|uniref:Amino acid transporter n=1 Tax=Pseudonocardia parietis TaxID=570936 RepID=A0ABS4VPX1_9PSEU|nr:amino acid permease [Pseudonocardia parietis]MBP2365974.1 amino acid transporter [Pseudonocardia parietis]
MNARARPGVREGARLGVLALAMINVAAIVSARNLPVMAEYGWAMLALFALAILVFLIPIAMVAAELGTAWPRDGGVYAWVKEAFGERAGFLAVWCDYAENVAWFPTVLSFMAASLAYAIDPALASNKVYLVVVMLTFFWATTLLSLRGVGASSRLGAIGTIAGSILPAVLVVGLGAAYLLRGHPSQIPFSAEALVPDVSLDNLAFLGGIVLLFTGMEMAGFHARDTRDPGRVVPRAIALCVGIVVAFSVLGSLFLAFVVPQQQISLVSGVMELFASVLDSFGAGWLLAPLALVVTLGGVAHLAPWILGPAKGVAAVAADGVAPARLGRVNRNDVPVGLLVAQGIGGSVFSLLFLLVPSVSTSYWMLSAVTAQIVIVMYALMFAAVVRLRHTRPATPRPYRIPGGLPGVWAVGGIGLAGCVFAFVLGFVPPSQLETGDTVVYVLLLGLAVVVLSLPPFLFALFRRARPTTPAPAVR